MANYAATARVYDTTLEHFVRGWSDETEEQHPILAALKEKGKIDHEGDGTQYREPIKYKRLNLAGYSDLEELDWQRKRLTKTFELPWRSLRMTDAISELELRQNQGQPARVRLFTDKLEKMKEDADDDLGKFFYYDGEAASHDDELHGFQSFCSHSAANSTDAFATTLDATYGGLSTARGNYGGSPKGGSVSGTNFESDDPEWDFWSPIQVNATYNDGSGALSWASDAQTLIGRAISQATRGNNKSHMLDLFTMSRQNHSLLKEQLRSKERIVVEPGPERSLMVKLGFKNVIQVDGVDCIIDPDVPAQTGGTTSVDLYACGWNFSKMKFCLLPPDRGAKKQFWNASGSVFNENDQSYKFWVGLYGNLIFKPRYFVEIAAYA